MKYILIAILVILSFGVAGAYLIDPNQQIDWTETITADITVIGDVSSNTSTATLTNETAINTSIAANKLSGYTNESAINTSIGNLEVPIVIRITKSDITNGEVNASWFTAPENIEIVSITEEHSPAEATAATMTVAVQKMTGTQALTGGINLTEAAFSLKGTANTVVTGVVSTLSGRAKINESERIGIICNMTGVTGADAFRTSEITISYKRV